MNCQECVKECKAAGGMCNPPDAEERLWYEQWQYDAVAEHKRAAHVMELARYDYRCPAGQHEPVEAHPAEIMRAAGMELLL